MGFKTGNHAMVWEVKPVSNVATDLRISVSKKNAKTGEYEQDFSGYVRCYGAECAAAAAKLNQKDRIKIGDIDVSQTYSKEKKQTYTNFKMFSFEMADGNNRNNGGGNKITTKPAKSKPAYVEVDEGDSDLPF